MPGSEPTVEVLRPTGRLRPVKGEPVPGVASLKDRVVGLLDNRKPNFVMFLDRTEALLTANYQVGEVVRRRKIHAGVGGGSVLDELARTCDLVITGSGD